MLPRDKLKYYMSMTLQSKLLLFFLLYPGTVHTVFIQKEITECFKDALYSKISLAFMFNLGHSTDCSLAPILVKSIVLPCIKQSKS